MARVALHQGAKFPLTLAEELWKVWSRLLPWRGICFERPDLYARGDVSDRMFEDVPDSMS